MFLVLDSLLEWAAGSPLVTGTWMLLLRRCPVEKLALKATLVEDEVILLGRKILLMPQLVLHFCVHIEQNDDLHRNGSRVLFACSPLLNDWCSAGT